MAKVVQNKKEKADAKAAAKEAAVDESVHGGKKGVSKESGADKAMKAAKKAAAAATEEGLRGIIRIAGKDVRGGIRLRPALTHVRGIGHSLSGPVSELIARELSVAPDIKVGAFSDEQIEQIDKILGSLQNYNLPKFMLNRRKDVDSGKDIHLIMNDLEFAQRNDVEGEKKLYTWKGYRHAYGQKVRGQKTRNTGRTGMSLGVMRKTIMAAAQAAKAAEGGKGGGAGAPAASPAAAAKPTAAAKPAAAEKK